MKKRNIFLGIGVGIIIVIGGWLISQDKIEVPTENIKQEVVLVIDDGGGSPKIFEIKFEEGMTAFGLLKSKTDELNIVLRTKTYDIGVFIEAIGDKENGEDGKYWLYYVDEEMPMVAADKKEIKPGEKVEFKFEESSF